MLRSLWHRLLYYWPEPSAEQALARYYRDEGLHAELVSHHSHHSHHSRDRDAPAGQAKSLYGAHSHFTA